jgi:hypothetical protein
MMVSLLRPATTPAYLQLLVRRRPSLLANAAWVILLRRRER